MFKMKVFKAVLPLAFLLFTGAVIYVIDESSGPEIPNVTSLDPSIKSTSAVNTIPTESRFSENTLNPNGPSENLSSFKGDVKTPEMLELANLDDELRISEEYDKSLATSAQRGRQRDEPEKEDSVEGAPEDTDSNDPIVNEYWVSASVHDGQAPEFDDSLESEEFDYSHGIRDHIAEIPVNEKPVQPIYTSEDNVYPDPAPEARAESPE